VELEDPVIVARGDLSYVRELRRELERVGIGSVAVRPPEDAGAG
jgi:hypothetical protein